MGLKLDSNAVLRAIADHPNAFLAMQKDIDAFAQKILSKQIKDKNLDLELVQEIHRATGTAAVATILDGLAPNEAITVLKKLDPHNPVTSGGDARAVRGCIDDLILGRAAPVAKPEKLPKVAAPKKAPTKAPIKPKIGDLLDSKVHAGTTKKARAKLAS